MILSRCLTFLSEFRPLARFQCWCPHGMDRRIPANFSMDHVEACRGNPDCRAVKKNKMIPQFLFFLTQVETYMLTMYTGALTCKENNKSPKVKVIFLYLTMVKVVTIDSLPPCF